MCGAARLSGGALEVGEAAAQCMGYTCGAARPASPRSRGAGWEPRSPEPPSRRAGAGHRPRGNSAPGESRDSYPVPAAHAPPGRSHPSQHCHRADIADCPGLGARRLLSSGTGRALRALQLLLGTPHLQFRLQRGGPGYTNSPLLALPPTGSIIQGTTLTRQSVSLRGVWGSPPTCPKELSQAEQC